MLQDMQEQKTLWIEKALLKIASYYLHFSLS